jgi:hypothetical protein
MMERSKRKKRKSCYLAGKMSGLPQWGFPAFINAAADLRDRGWIVYSPAEHDLELGFDPNEDTFEPAARARSMHWDLDHIFVVDAIVVLPGWENGRGARCEVALARFLDLPVLSYPTLMEIKP